MSTQYFCKNKERRDLIEKYKTLNGIDFLEVLGQCTLVIHLVNPLDSSITLERKNFLIDGGVRIRDINIIAGPTLDAAKKEVTLEVDKAGDFSTYTLRIVQGPDHLIPLEKFDPILSEIDFFFKVECPSEFDCKLEEKCPPFTFPAPGINYLAKDYASFRRLMLDRLSVLMPGWQERNPADLQVALVELLAYVGDRLSYYQDAAATEAYLGTARQRVSVRRHARLVDYFMHDGCNARAWVHLHYQGVSPVTVPAKTKLLTRCSNTGTMIDTVEAEKIMAQQKPEVFETMFPIVLHQAHHEMKFYTWGDSECCLPKGAVKATLLKKGYQGEEISLQKGDFLLFAEDKSPVTGESQDRDPFHRHVVRLTRVEYTTDDLFNPPVPVVNIRWHQEDALPFPFCISTVKKKQDTLIPVNDVSTARGNMAAADHGSTTPGTFTPAQIKNRHVNPPRFPGGPLTCTEGFVPGEADSAASAMRRKLKQCCPAAVLMENPLDEDTWWWPQKDLLASSKFKRHFVVETESDGTGFLRFGDDILGKEPDTDKELKASYRVGNGTAGNVGAGVISHIVLPQGSGITGIKEVHNPLPAQGGTDPESIEEVRQFAPQAFRTQERAVTRQDYAEKAMKYKGVQKAVATFRWTGSWTTVFLVVDREGGKPVQEDPQFKKGLYQHMEKYRTAGFDLEIADPVFVPLDIALNVCVKPGYFKSHIKEVLLEVFSSYEWAPGNRGFFHPDNFTFGQPVVLSRIYEAVLKVDGAASVQVTRLQRKGKAPDNEIENGLLNTDRVEIIRLDNDPNFPENGTIEFEMKGGM